MAYSIISLLPGIFKDDTPLSAEGFFVDADKVRFVRGKAQTIGGWERASEDSFSGICRGLLAWQDNLARPYAAIGTHTHLQAYFDGEIYDISPVIERGRLSDPFDTTMGSATVNVSHTAHGREAGDRVRFENASTVGGITINGEFVITAISGPDDFIITHGSAAASTASGGGTVDFEYLLGAGLPDSTGGSGYGTGAYSIGGYGVPSDTDYFLRTWSLDSWGQNLLASPRGGAIYEWAPLFVSAELVTNGDFSDDSDWTKGAGWAISAGAASKSAGSASTLEQPVMAPPGAWYLLAFDFTRSAGTLQPQIGGISIGNAISAASGHVKAVFAGQNGNIAFHGDAAFIGSVDNVSIQQLTRAHAIPEAPGENACIFVTPERITVSAGTVESDTGLFNPLHLRWSDQENNREWTPTAANQAGSFTLAKGGRIVAAKAGREENYIWTDEGLYAMRYVPDPAVVYSFTHIGSGCGLIGPNAAIVASGKAFWLSNTGEFYRYTGGVPEPLQSTCRRHIFENLAKVQSAKVYAFSAAAYNEVWWLYPDMRDGNECSRYAAYNFIENTWSTGQFDRSAWIDAGALPYPLAADLAGNLVFHEKGNSADGGPLAWSLKTAAFDIGDGDSHVSIMGCIPDMDDFLGGAHLTIRTRRYPNSSERAFGPYDISSSTEKIDIRAEGRQADFQLHGKSAPAFMRLGALRLDLRQAGIRR